VLRDEPSHPHRALLCRRLTCLSAPRRQALTAIDLRGLFDLLNEELRSSATKAELYLVGGAVMCQVFNARPPTQDVDAVFRPSEEVRKAAARVARRAGVDPDWLNDGVKSFLSPQGEFAPFLELDHLNVMVALPEYMLAMRSLAMRIGTEFHAEDDVRYLLRHLDVRSYEKAIAIVTKYFPHSSDSHRRRSTRFGSCWHREEHGPRLADRMRATNSCKYHEILDARNKIASKYAASSLLFLTSLVAQ
jgi:hypothetical protein